MDKEYILVVEDSKTINYTISSQIRSDCNIEVLSALNFAECEKYVDEYRNSITIALTDLTLPDCPDAAAAEYTLKNSIPTIVLTGSFSEETEEELFKKGVSDYFIKENNDSLKQTVKAVKRLLKNRTTKILVVDDSKIYLSYYRQILTRQLFKPFYAKDGKEALKILERKKDIQLVVTDYNMPECNGLDLTKKIRSKHSKDEMAIIVLSDGDNAKIPAKMLKFGANDFIIKPFSNEEFIKRVHSSLEILDLFQEAEDRANKDFMTGMYNRRYFFDEGYKEFIDARDAKKDLYVAMIDIDKFKNINDTYGHDIGDIAIKEVAKVLDKNLSKYLPVISRFGGEEFCMILKDLSHEEVEKIYEEVRADFESNIIKVDDLEFSYTISIGITKVTGGTLDEAVKVADQNLYDAKEGGRNRVIFT